MGRSAGKSIDLSPTTLRVLSTIKNGWSHELSADLRRLPCRDAGLDRSGRTESDRGHVLLDGTNCSRVAWRLRLSKGLAMKSAAPALMASLSTPRCSRALTTTTLASE